MSAARFKDAQASGTRAAERFTLCDSQPVKPPDCGKLAYPHLSAGHRT